MVAPICIIIMIKQLFQVLQHFSDLSNSIVDVRLPNREEGKKSCIAYVELKDEHSYEVNIIFKSVIVYGFWSRRVVGVAHNIMI